MRGRASGCASNRLRQAHPVDTSSPAPARRPKIRPHERGHLSTAMVEKCPRSSRRPRASQRVSPPAGGRTVRRRSRALGYRHRVTVAGRGTGAERLGTMDEELKSDVPEHEAGAGRRCRSGHRAGGARHLAGPDAGHVPRPRRAAAGRRPALDDAAGGLGRGAAQADRDPRGLRALGGGAADDRRDRRRRAAGLRLLGLPRALLPGDLPGPRRARPGRPRSGRCCPAPSRSRRRRTAAWTTAPTCR